MVSRRPGAGSRSPRRYPRFGGSANPLLAIGRPIALQHLGKARIQRGLDLRIAFEPRHQHGGGLERGEPVAARLAAQLAVARRALAREQHAAALEHPGVAPPHRLGLAPGAVEQDDALDVAQRRFLVGQGSALAGDHHDVAAGRERLRLERAEIENRPALRIGLAAEHFRQRRPRQADLEMRVLEMPRRQPRRAEQAVLLLRMLQDEQFDAVVERRDEIADAQRRRLEAMRAVRCFRGLGQCVVAH